MGRVILRHLSGTKTDEIDEFDLNEFDELLIGRDPSAQIQYHPEKEDLVGRRHARIAHDDEESDALFIEDLNSRNGTYVNRRRVYGRTRVTTGDVIQFGPGGPEIKVEVDLDSRGRRGDRPQSGHYPAPRGSGWLSDDTSVSVEVTPGPRRFDDYTPAPEPRDDFTPGPASRDDFTPPPKPRLDHRRDGPPRHEQPPHDRRSDQPAGSQSSLSPVMLLLAVIVFLIIAFGAFLLFGGWELLLGSLNSGLPGMAGFSRPT